MRTLRRLGIASVTVYTDSDRDALHVRRADLALRVESDRGYLDGPAIIDAALRAGAQAVHPGYGFLAENAAFASGCAAAGLTFIGPPVAAIEAMGDKINAKRAVAAAGVPVVPGRDEAGLDDAAIAAAARQIGWPVLLKPSAGGGGKGMRLVTDEADLMSAIESARREARGAFGDDTLLVERFISDPRHIEIQVFADTQGHTVSLGDRECSLQRRHQKIVEESPSPLLDTDTRAATSASAVDAARACGYVGAGTVEFIVPSADPSRYYFMEMNTRLQVEHPVTEMVLSLDLVEWQIRVAAGEPIPWSDPTSTPKPKGHAVEARVYAEDPSRGFLPSSGTVHLLGQPHPVRGRIRVDSALYDGLSVGTGYDPMLAKIVGWGETRADALATLDRALAQTDILGPTTNVAFLRRLIQHPDVRAGRLDTGLVERVTSDLLPGPVPDHVVAAVAALDCELDRAATNESDPWSIRDGWRMAGPAAMVTRWQGGENRVIEVVRRRHVMWIDGGDPVEVRCRISGTNLSVEYAGVTRFWKWATDRVTYWIGGSGEAWSLTLQRDSLDRSTSSGAATGTVTSPMPGTVLEVYVTEGETVESGQRVATVEAMKMEHAVTAPHPGVVTDVLVRAGDSVKLDQPLAIIVGDAPGDAGE
jgi:acetyl-CoA/propionyl-CoA carboxylase biotin carboxyl carrier protein